MATFDMALDEGYGQENRIPDSGPSGSLQPGLPSPPPSSPAASRTSFKAKRPPPITPNRFNRFFTPRNGGDRDNSGHGRALREISANSGIYLPDESPDSRPLKRRKICFSAAPISPSSRASSPPVMFSSPPPAYSSSPVRCRVTLPRLEFDSPRVIRAQLSAPIPHSQTDIADFCSVPRDVQTFQSQGIPFSVTACHTNSLVAIGTDYGNVHVLDTGDASSSRFNEIYLSTRPHRNAITDLDFSHDDHLLATASGDQTARIVDMFTRESLYVLPEHSSSIKRISFAPNSDSLVATCSRDGVVGIWDLRYRLREPVWRAVAQHEGHMATRGVSMIKSIVGAHPALPSKPSSKALCITSLQFLRTAGREHLFMTACEGNSQLRLWDIRNKGSSGNGSAVPVAVSRDIDAHRSSRRSWGITSLALSGDSSRIFSTCRDSIIYAYSTNHLVLGQAPELAVPGGSRWARDSQTGAGPLYGITHPSFRPNSFWVRCALRPAQRDQQELLAVGNTDNSPILFPTDEAAFHRHGAARRADPILGCPARWASSNATSPNASLHSRHASSSTLPIYNLGAALVRGHRKEVSVPCWTHNGDLVTISDDNSARVWRQDAGQARSLRTGGEHEGRRWMCGWADVDSSFDEEDG